MKIDVFIFLIKEVFIKYMEILEKDKQHHQKQI